MDVLVSAASAGQAVPVGRVEIAAGFLVADPGGRMAAATKRGPAVSPPERAWLRLRLACLETMAIVRMVEILPLRCAQGFGSLAQDDQVWRSTGQGLDGWYLDGRWHIRAAMLASRRGRIPEPAGSVPGGLFLAPS